MMTGTARRNNPRMSQDPSALNEAARRTTLLAETEVLVLGGGPAGIAAAASAAAAGREVLLVERYGFLGGMGTAAGVTNFCGLHANVHGEMKRVVHGVADELLQRIDALGGLNEPHAIFGRTLAQAYDGAAYKCAADELLLARGVKLLFHALAAGVACTTMASDSTRCWWKHARAGVPSARSCSSTRRVTAT